MHAFSLLKKRSPSDPKKFDVGLEKHHSHGDNGKQEDSDSGPGESSGKSSPARTGNGAVPPAAVANPGPTTTTKKERRNSILQDLRAKLARKPPLTPLRGRDRTLPLRDVPGQGDATVSVGLIAFSFV